jgi:hypothetical protein
MAVPLPEDLQTYGISDKDYKRKLKAMTKKDGKEPEPDLVVEGLFHDLIKKARNWDVLQVLYWNLAVFKDSRGKDSWKEQQKSHQCRLKQLKEANTDKVKINASACCAECAKLHNVVLGTQKALFTLPVPNRKCLSTLTSEHRWCTSMYMPADPNAAESPNPPPADPDVPEEPELAGGGGEDSERDGKPAVTAADVAQAAQAAAPYGLTAAGVAAGVAMAMLMPLGVGLIPGIALAVMSLTFMPGIWDRIAMKFPALRGEWTRRGLWGLLLLLLLLIALLLLLLEEPKKPTLNPDTLPSYSLNSMEDRSVATRSRAQASITAPEAVSPQEYARIAAKAAQDLVNQRNAEGKRFEFVTVVLEDADGNPLAIVDYAPDGQGREGVMSDRPENKYQWDIRVADPQSGQLRPMLKR